MTRYSIDRTIHYSGTVIPQNPVWIDAPDPHEAQAIYAERHGKPIYHLNSGADRAVGDWLYRAGYQIAPGEVLQVDVYDYQEVMS